MPQKERRNGTVGKTGWPYVLRKQRVGLGDAVSILCMGTLSLWDRTLQWLHVQESLAVSVKKAEGGSSGKKASDVYFPAMGPRCL